MISVAVFRRLCCAISFGACCAIASAATLESIRAEIDTILARPAVAGNTWSILVESESGSTMYYDRDKTVTRKPASITKLFTTGAAFGRLGPNHQFNTRIYRTANIDGAGKLTGDLYLIGEH